MRHLPLTLLGLVLACARDSQPAAAVDHRAADEATIRGIDSAWVKAAAAKNADQVASYYADDASVMAPGEAIATGKTAIRAAWVNMLGLPGAALTFAPDKVDVSGDRAFDIGTYQLTANDKSGKPQTTKARYVLIWGRQPDGSWKVLVDVSTTTQ
jgi:uncharacterized protein (TIGR02246 family)